MSDELRELDREWAEIAKARLQLVFAPAPGSKTSSVYQPAPYSSDPVACFGPGGPWEWLVNHEYFFLSVHSPTDFVCEGSHIIGVGSTPFEAITRCAIEARKKMESTNGT